VRVVGANVAGEVFLEAAHHRSCHRDASLGTRGLGLVPEGHTFGLAERLHIAPADATVELAQSNPNLLMGQVPDHCRQLDDVLRAVAHQREMLASSEFNSDPIVEAAHTALTTR
jgi:hypothetical protein